MGLDDDTAVKTCGAGEVMETGGQHVEEELVVAVTVQDAGMLGMQVGDELRRDLTWP